MSKKYNEIMDKVVVTDEMRRRVLKEISSADPEKLAAYKIDADEDFANVFIGRKRFPAAKILAGLAVACVLILIAGIIRISQPLMSPSMTGSVEYEEAKEYAAEEAEEDTMVGNQDMVDQPELTGGEAADEGIADTEEDSERSWLLVILKILHMLSILSMRGIFCAVHQYPTVATLTPR